MAPRVLDFVFGVFFAITSTSSGPAAGADASAKPSPFTMNGWQFHEYDVPKIAYLDERHERLFKAVPNTAGFVSRCTRATIACFATIA